LTICRAVNIITCNCISKIPLTNTLEFLKIWDFVNTIHLLKRHITAQNTNSIFVLNAFSAPIPKFIVNSDLPASFLFWRKKKNRKELRTGSNFYDDHRNSFRIKKINEKGNWGAVANYFTKIIERTIRHLH
jgi:hypothetical protein